LAKEASRIPVLAETLVPTYMDLFVCCVPLHDLGNVTLPDHILLKPGKLEPDERLLMQTHTLAGSETLRTVAQECSSSVVFLQMGIDICRSHHERFDGQGYPDRLAGDAIPLAARMVALADVYDALRSRRPHKPALSHPVAVQLLREGSPGQFDPSLLKIFEQYASQFEEIYRSEPD
jgi:HD-GYP domain-containing protein (c-di-GMP phosphodiesterase class II)